jgi:hypothetical protein
MKKLALMICILTLLFFQINCANQVKSNPVEDKLVTFGPSENTDLVVIFQKGVSNEEILKFQNEVIGPIRDENGNGFKSLPGMGNGYSFNKNGYEGEGINFRENATAEQKESIKKRVKDSKIVYKVFEDTSPNKLENF